MKREETIKTTSGAKLKATVDLTVDLRAVPIWQFRLYRCQKGKRTWERVNIETEAERAFVFEVARNLWVTLQPNVEEIPLVTVSV